MTDPQKTTIKLGKSDAGELLLDVDRLLASRMLVTATSGGGKSWLLRKILEEVSATTQTIVIDPEGEFASLRELRDMVLVGGDGDLPADPRTAGLLARRLMEKHVSAVIDLFELPPTQRRDFVARFCNELVDLPKSLWHDCFIAVDETHEFAPEGETYASGKALALLSSKGRKRGFCPLYATQRLAKLDKDLAAEARNQFVGMLTLDVDQKRAGDSLGFPKARLTELRDLSPPGKEGEFFAVGPALSERGVIKFRAGKVLTTHPTAGEGKISSPPKPSRAIAGVLKEFAGLTQQAEEEARNLADAHKRIGELTRELAAANKQQPAAKPEAKRVEVPVLKEQDLRRIEKLYVGICQRLLSIESRIFKEGPLAEASLELSRLVNLVADGVKLANTSVVTITSKPKVPELRELAKRPIPAVTREKSPAAGGSNGSLPQGEAKVLTAVAQHPEGVTREQLTILTGYKRSSRDTYLQRLRARELINDEGSTIQATAEGIAQLGANFARLPTGDALREHWLQELPDGERRCLQVLIAAHPNAVERNALEEATGYKRSSRDTYLQRLKARRLIDDAGRGQVRAADLLFD